MCALPVYRRSEPGSFSLLDELARRRSTAKTSPQEDQLTIMLAWLCDHSDAIGANLARAWVKGDPEATTALKQAGQLSARVQPVLPALPDGGCRADLSLAGADQSFQLLVEAKLSSPFMWRRVGRKRVSQPDAYIHAWERCDPKFEAAVRRVGTVRLDGDPPADIGHPWRVRDLTWKDILRVVNSAIASGGLDSDIRVVASDFCWYLQHRVLRPTVTPAMLDHGAKLVRAVCQRLADELPDAMPAKSVQTSVKHSYAGTYLNGFTTKYSKNARFWLAFTPAATSYNVPGWPTVVHIRWFDPWDDGTEASLLQSGCEPWRDRAGYNFLGASILESPLATRSFDDQVEQAVLRGLDLVSDLRADRLTERRRTLSAGVPRAARRS